MSTRRSARVASAATSSSSTTPAASTKSSTSSSAKSSRKRTRAKRDAKHEEAEEEEEIEEESKEQEKDSADEDTREDEDDEEEEDEGALLAFGKTTSDSNILSGTLTHSISRRVAYKGYFKTSMEHEKHGAGVMYFRDGSQLEGTFVDDEIRGEGTYTSADGSKIIGTYVEGGVLEGEDIKEYDDAGVLCFRGAYRDSVRHGFGVLSLPDGGQLSGQFVDGVFEGEGNEYIYPPGLGSGQKASLKGTWKEGQMKAAKFYINDVLDEGRKDQTFEYDEPTATRISSHPLLADPYESLCVYSKPSTIPNSNDGLFALRDLPANTIVTWYSGTKDAGYKSEKRKWEENSNTISLIDDEIGEDGEIKEIDIDVSEEYSTTDKYCASLAHKCNHIFHPARLNAKYDMALHPRFGLIKSIRTLPGREVKKDEELFVDYGYELKKDKKTGKAVSGGPKWYREAFNEEVERKKREENGGETSAAASSSSGSSAKTASTKRTTKRTKR